MNRVALQEERQAITSFPPASGHFQRQRAYGQHTSVGGECEERKQKPEGTLQRAAISSSSVRDVPSIVHDVLRSSGQPLDAATRALMEPRFGHDFSGVRVHTDAGAAESAQAVNALAFTVGRDIAFAYGQYAPSTNEGRKLIAHELTHVVQQSASPAGKAKRLEMGPPLSNFERAATAFAHDAALRSAGARLPFSEISVQVQRQPRPGAGNDKPTPPKLNYRTAERFNKSFARPNSLGWESKLETVSGGSYKSWADLWKAGQYDEFADAVAQFQSDSGFRKKDIDGILGLATWPKIAGLGEAIAGIQDVQWASSETTCTMATKERIVRGHKLATGKKFELPEDKSAQTFNIILQSMESRMADIDKEYRGTGAAGALVYAGLATFVNETAIWTGGLRPGAAMQVWGNRNAYHLMQAGVIKDAQTGKLRKIGPDDANFYGTSFVFVRYDDPAKPTRMLVRHFGSDEWKAPADYAVWIAANIN